MNYQKPAKRPGNRFEQRRDTRLDTAKTPLKRLLCTALLGLALAPSIAVAERHALLIGISQYQGFDGKIDLPGGENDLRMMNQIVRGMGVSDDNLIELSNSDATRDAVLAALDSINRKTGSEDELIVYFSGHGAQIPDSDGDEADAADEVLAFYDLAVQRQDGKVSLTGMLTDDELAGILANATAGQTTFIVDACNSGSIAKLPLLNSENDNNNASLDETVGLWGKSLHFPALWQSAATDTASASANRSVAPAGETVLPLNPQGSRLPGFNDIEASGTIVMSATDEDGLAISEASGSTYTRALFDAFTNNTEQATPWCMHATASRAVRADTATEQRPRLLGDWRLAQSPFLTSSSEAETRSNRFALAALDNLAQCHTDAAVQLDVSQTALSLGERLTVEVVTNAPGWLTLFVAHGEELEVFPWPLQIDSTQATVTTDAPSLSAFVELGSSLSEVDTGQTIESSGATAADAFVARGEWDVSFSEGSARLLAVLHSEEPAERDYFEATTPSSSALLEKLLHSMDIPLVQSQLLPTKEP